LDFYDAMLSLYKRLISGQTARFHAPVLTFGGQNKLLFLVRIALTIYSFFDVVIIREITLPRGHVASIENKPFKLLGALLYQCYRRVHSF
jgi:hypothetical protein